jgi:hypothetical protein
MADYFRVLHGRSNAVSPDRCRLCTLHAAEAVARKADIAGWTYLKPSHDGLEREFKFFK